MPALPGPGGPTATNPLCSYSSGSGQRGDTTLPRRRRQLRLTALPGLRATGLEAQRPKRLRRTADAGGETPQAERAPRPAPPRGAPLPHGPALGAPATPGRAGNRAWNGDAVSPSCLGAAPEIQPRRHRRHYGVRRGPNAAGGAGGAAGGGHRRDASGSRGRLGDSAPQCASAAGFRCWR